MPDKSSDGMKRILRAKRTKPVRAHKKLELGSERVGHSPGAMIRMKGPVRNKG